MKSMIIVAFALVAVAAAAPAEEIKILRSEFDQQPDGPFSYVFETENGISAQAQGELKQGVDEDNKPVSYLAVRGSYSYPGEDGQPISISYVADDQGYRAEGDTIPQVPTRR